MPFTHSWQVIANLDGVPDVVITAPADWQGLVYNSATWKWENETILGSWDMLRSIYDTDLDGKVDTSNDVSNAPLITRSSVASQWGLLINIDSATGDIARTTNGWNEDEKYWCYSRQWTGGWSSEFDTAVTRTWTKTLKISTTTTAWTASVIINADNRDATFAWNKRTLTPLKPSTKYKLSCWVKTSNVVATWVELTYWTWDSNYANRSFSIVNLWWTNDWTYLTNTFTTWVSVAFGTTSVAIALAWNISDAWFDINSMTLEEVVEPVANSLTAPTPSLVSFTAVGSTDNIDQSQTTSTWQTVVGSSAWVNYWNAQSFTPTKSKHTWVIFNKKANVWTPTWDIVFNLRTDNAWDPSATILATYTMPLATYNALTTNADFTVNLPANLTAGTKYHYVIYDTATETGTNNFWLLVNSAWGYSGWDCRISTNSGSTWAVNWTYDFYFKTLYYKPTTNFKASQNNSTVSISADEDGFLNTWVHNLSTWTFSFSQLNDTSALMSWSLYSMVPNLYSYTTTTTNGTFDILYRSGTTISMKWAIVWTVVCTYKINMTLLSSILVTGCVRYVKAEYSYNNSSWTTINDNSWTLTEIAISQSIPASWSYVYLRFTTWNAANSAYIGSATNPFNITWVIDISSLSTLKNYPTNKDVVTTYNKTLTAATTTATYRATKWGFPAIEYSATEYQFLDVDTTATWSVVKFSSDWVTYSTVADGANIALSSTTTPLVWVKTNITANRLYLSSNDYNASGDKDGSNKMTVGYQVLSQGLTYDMRELQEDVETLMIASGKVVTAITGNISTEADIYTITPTATGNINLLEIPPAWKKFTLLVKTSGTTSYTLTFNTAFKSTGTLATWVVDAKYFALEFISDGIQALELSRTTAM